MPKPSGVTTALILAPEAPYPPVGGGAIRAASLLEYFRSSGVDLHVITWHEPGSADPREAFPEDVTVDVIKLPWHDKSARGKAIRNLDRFVRGVPPMVDRFSGFEREITALTSVRSYDVALLEHMWVAGYADVLRPVARRLVVDLVDVESMLLSRAAMTHPFPLSFMFRRWARAAREMEQNWLPRFDTVLVTSAADSAHISVRSEVYPNTIPPVPEPLQAGRRENELVFSGNWEYHPNTTGARWFVREIWPQIKANSPGVRCRFLGRNEHAIRDLVRDDPDLVLTGPVENAIVSLAESAVAIVPLLSGSGTRLKIIEAWAAGLPVVTTTIGVEGLPGVPGEEFVVADGPRDFTRAVVNLLQEPGIRRRQGAAGRRLYEKELTWTAAWRRLRDVGL